MPYVVIQPPAIIMEMEEPHPATAGYTYRVVSDAEDSRNAVQTTRTSYREIPPSVSNCKFIVVKTTYQLLRKY